VNQRTAKLHSDTRQTGRKAVFSAIQRAGRIPRVEIARQTGISPATVTAITQELMRAGLIEEVEWTSESDGDDARRGRPPVGLKVRGKAGLVAGVKIGHESLMIGICDLEGRVIGEHRVDIPATPLEPREVVRLIHDALVAGLVVNGMGLDDLSGVGIGLSGFVDARRGFVHWSPSLAVRNVALRDALEAAIPLPFFLDNDANLVAKAEQLFGFGRGVANFVVVTIEQGVGLGIVVDHELYRGTRGCGAEFGHTKVHLDGALCRCGQRGCLEAYVAEYALLREADIILGPEPSWRGATTVERLMRLDEIAREGNEAARSIFRRAGRMFALGLSNIVNLFDPELIILAGEQLNMDHLCNADVMADLRRWSVKVDAPPARIRTHRWGDLMWAQGAAAMAVSGVTERALEALTAEGADAR